MAFNAHFDSVHPHLAEKAQPTTMEKYTASTRDHLEFGVFLTIRVILAIFVPIAMVLTSLSSKNSHFDNLFLMGMLGLSIAYSVMEIVIYVMQLVKGTPYRLDSPSSGTNEEDQTEVPLSRPNVRGGPFFDFIIGLSVLAPIINWMEQETRFRNKVCVHPTTKLLMPKGCDQDPWFESAWILGISIACIHMILGCSSTILYIVFFCKRK